MFAPSAGNRDSVLSLGSIAHLQYYFARTGLLDGKGGQLAKESNANIVSAHVMPRVYDNVALSHSPTLDVSPLDNNQDPEEPLMLPPTVSTYSHKIQYLPPPPDLDTLRQDLKNALCQAKKALQDVHNHESQDTDADQENGSSKYPGEAPASRVPSCPSKSSGWDEIQGVHILDVVTLAIRAAKIYYTSHEDPQRLYSIKSERQIRQELYEVLDILKRMASRNFSGGMREDELNVIKYWVEGIDSFLSTELELEAQEKSVRDSWVWLDGSWEGRERERERLFLSSFLPEGTLPDWTAVATSSSTPTPFVEALHTGLVLVHLHNALVKESKRQFGDIKTFHTDLAKPYRCAENLRYWIKAAELRWETKLKVNVSGVVNKKNEAWTDFDCAILQWSTAVREELTKEWREPAVRLSQVTSYLDDHSVETSSLEGNNSRI